MSVPDQDPLSISQRVERDVFEMFGRLDQDTLRFANAVHLRAVPADSPVRYLIRCYPLRPELLEPGRRDDRIAYHTGLLVGAVAVWMYKAEQGAGPEMRMPPNPDADEDIRRVGALAVNSRFWLQKFFTTSDILAVVRREVEMPLRERVTGLRAATAAIEGEPRDDYLVIGMGDILALCAVLRTPGEQLSTLPLEQSMTE